MERKNERSNEEDGNTSKRMKLCEGIEENGLQEQTLIHANDLIKIVFQGLKDQFYSPMFTHQLFEEEMIDFLSSEENNVQVTVFVDVLQGLSQRVLIQGTASGITKQMLQNNLRPGLPKDVLFIDSEDSLQVAPSIPVPIGKLHSNFTCHNRNYQVYLATDQDHQAAELLFRAEKLAMWYIETADSVDFSDPRWEVLFLFEQSTSNTLLFVGYLTLFTFHNPVVGDKLRICQCLILPPLQGQGLGRELLLIAYRIAQTRDAVVEVTVEDPCPEFQCLRDAIDLEWYFLHCNDCERKDIEEMAKTLKILPAQADVIVEALDYLTMLKETIGEALEYNPEGLNEDEIEDIVPEPMLKLKTLLLAMTATSATPAKHSSTDWDELLKTLHEETKRHDNFSKFRLRVKRTLLKEDKELKCLEKVAMQTELSTRFDERVQRYMRLTKVAMKIGLLIMPYRGPDGTTHPPELRLNQT